MDYNDMKTTKAIEDKASAYKELVKALKNLKRKCGVEEGKAKGLRERKAKLELTCADALAKTQQGYEKCRTDLRRLAIDVDASVSMVDMFNDTVIPAKEREVRAAKIALETLVRSFLRDNKAKCESEMTALLAPVMAEKDKWQAYCEKLHTDNGITFRQDKELIPQATHPRINSTGNFFNIVPLTIEQRMAKM